MVEEKLIWKEIWKNQGALIPFLRGQDARHSSSECPPEINQIAPFIIAPPIIIKINKEKNLNLAFSRATIT